MFARLETLGPSLHRTSDCSLRLPFVVRTFVDLDSSKLRYYFQLEQIPVNAMKKSVFSSMCSSVKRWNITKQPFNLRRHIGYPLRINAFLQTKTNGSKIAYSPEIYNQFVGKGLLYRISAFICGITQNSGQKG